MSRASGVLAALKAVPGGARYTPAPQSGGYGRISPVAANAMYQNPYSGSYGPFLPRPSRVFTDGAFGPMSPIQPVPVDEPAVPGGFPDPRWWQYPVGWNLPTQPRAEGLSMASFAQLKTISERYSIARKCIQLRTDEILGLEWQIELTTQAAKAYQGDYKAMKDFGERAALATKFFRRPDPDYNTFSSWLGAVLEEIFVYDALALIFRPKYGKGLGRGLLGSDLDSVRLVSGPTIRPVLDMHGGHPAPPSVAWQQYLYGVPRSDYPTVINGSDIDEYGLTGAEVNSFRADVMWYVPLNSRRETPYGFPPVEQALLPIISGLQKQEFQLDYFTEGSIPGCYISPGDTNMTPTQIRELQDALNGIAGDPAYHLKVIVLPPDSKVMPQRPVDLSDSFDYLVMNQVCMMFDCLPTELGIIPNVGGSTQGPSASGIRMAAAEARDIKTRKATKPLLMYLCDIFNYVLQDICGQQDMQFAFEGLVDDEDKAAITELGVQQVQNGISSIDEVRERLDLAPWGLRETSEPVVFTAQGPIPLSMAADLIASAQAGAGGSQGTNSGQKTPSSRSRTSQPSVRRGGQTLPNGTHPKPVSPHRESLTPAHSAASGAIQSPTPRTGGTPSRSPVAGSRKRGEAATGRATHHKAVASELDALRRHLRKGRLISTWVAEHLPERALGMIAEDLAKGVLIDTAVERAQDICLKAGGPDPQDGSRPVLDSYPDDGAVTKAAAHWPGWERDLGLVGAYKNLIGQAFHDAETKGSALRKKAATGGMFVSGATLRDLISDEVREVFSEVLNPLWTEAWHLGYAAAKSLVTGQPADFTVKQEDSDALAGFIATEGGHWLQQISRTGLGNNSARSELIARTEVGRAINSAAIECYRDHGVQFKHLLLSPNACDLCKDAAEDGDIPLDAPFSAGGVIGAVHPGDRCVPAPSWVDVEPPLADLGKASGGSVKTAQDDDSRCSFLLIRARSSEDGKLRYLLHLRSDSGEWDLPGGSAHIGEDPWATALREATEEIGPLPALQRRVSLVQHREDKTVTIFLCDAPFFQPSLAGTTPDETLGVGWYKRKEVGDLNLSDAFRGEWEAIDWKDVTKALQRMVNENGEVLTLTPASQALQAVGSRWPYPHRSDGAEWPDAGPGSVPDPHGSAGGEPPHRVNDFAEPDPHGDVAPRGSDDGKMPSRGRKPAPPAAVFPNQGAAHDEMWPYPQTTLTPAPASPVGAGTGVPPSGEKRRKVSKESVNYRHGTAAEHCGNCAMYSENTCDLVRGQIEPLDTCDRWITRSSEKNDSGHPVVGIVPPQAGQPYKPHTAEPEAFDPAETVEDWQPEGDTNVVHTLPHSRKGASDYADPNPVEAEHVKNLMRSNFPEPAISWVGRSSWVGPVDVPWDRINDHSIDSWAASHQPAKVNEFARELKKDQNSVKPSICIQGHDGDKVDIIDGHHRALAHKKLGQPIRCYLGTVKNPKDVQAALETHAMQFHSGTDPRNK